MTKLIYLASPYSDPDLNVQRYRYVKVCEVAALLLNQSHLVFSPIAHGYGITKYGFVDGDWRRWRLLSEVMISRCDQLWIAMLPGWESSVGVKAEARHAKECDRPILYLNTTTFELLNTPL